MQVTYAPDEPRWFWLQEKPEDPQIEPRAGIKMAQGLVSLVYICGIDPGTDCAMWFSKEKISWKNSYTFI